jgi:hypothetical protein
LSDALIYIAVLYTYNPYIASHYNKQLEQSTNKMEDMYKQAILDAKAVRASAMANAKATLQEAFEPKIQEMIRLKLSEELEDEGEMEEFDEMKMKGHKEEEDEAKKEEEMDEASLEEILAELEELSQKDEADMSYQYDEGDLDEAKEEMDEYADELDEADEEEGEGEEDAEEDGEEESEEEDGEQGEAPVEDDTKVIDITLGDLKQVLQSVMGGQEPDGDEAGAEEGGEEAGEEGKSADVDLDEILAELDKMKKEEGKKSKEMDEKKEEEDEAKKQLAEANKAIKVLRHELNEVNLLNAKLLYMNKIFKSKNLSESQKVNVVSALDRATNTKEAKNIYETLKETLSTRKSQISESKGFASNPAGVAPKKTIVEADTFVSRWQKIAGIK